MLFRRLDRVHRYDIRPVQNLELNQPELLACRAAAYTVVPNKAPTAAVTAIAKALQQVTRIIPGMIFAPPVRAAKPPRQASEINAAAVTVAISHCCGVQIATNSGSNAPLAKLAAEVMAACNGRAELVAEMPSSSRACAPSASCYISFCATSRANGIGTPRCT